MKQVAIKNNQLNEHAITSPNTCIVNATIIKIHAPDTSILNSWCSRYSCEAELKIDAISNCGSAATGMIDLTRGISVKFKFTLAPTDSVDQSIPFHLPGLKTGDKIRAALTILPSMNDQLKYSIETYKLLY